MHPVLFRLGRFAIHPYGLLLAVSFLVGIVWALKRAQKRGLNKDHVMDLAIIVIVSSIFGSRFFYVVTHLSEFSGRWTDTFNPFQSTGEIGLSGLSMLGGVAFALVSIIVYGAKKKMPLLKFFDAAAPSLTFGLALTRIGCFLNGCCFGKQCDLPWGMVFPLDSPAGSTLPGLKLHPTQLYSSLFDWVLLAALVLLDRKKRFDGFLAAAFFIGYGLFRFSIDFVRFYEPSVQVKVAGTAFTFNQIISLSLVLAGAAIWLLKPKHPRNK
jgi:phosphatidylglycerol:prolipoprotein diacylglycerol transferase